MIVPTLFVGLVVVATFLVAYSRHRDTFHPAVLMSPMLGFHYVFSPLQIRANDGFVGFLSEEMVERAQWIHFVGVLAFCLGLVVPAFKVGRVRLASLRDDIDRRRLLQGAVILGVVGLSSFLYGVINVGGFLKAYGSGYGGGWAESGWVRDLTLLSLPALILASLSREGRRLVWKDILLITAFASPFLIHGLLGGRRGPTFLVIAGTAMVLYFSRAKRPSLATLGVGGLVLGLLLLTLVSNRENVYIGSDFSIERSPTDYFEGSSGNDFIYGAGLVLVADETQDFNWGATYLTMLFVRPIPRAVWPTKYRDAAEFFNTPSLEENLGVDIRAFRGVLGWTAALGSAPGIVGDLWRELSWGMVPALFLLAWFYAHAWKRAVARAGAWVPVYCFLASLSLYLIMQTLEAMLYRFLFGVGPMLIALAYARVRSRSTKANVGVLSIPVQPRVEGKVG